MADSTVTALAAASALDGSELFYTVQGAADKKATGTQIKTLATDFSALSAAAAASDTDTLVVNQGAGNLKQLFSAIKTWIKSWVYPNGYVSGNWHLGAMLGTTSVVGLAMSVTVQYMMPFQVFQTITVSDLGIRTTTAGTSNIQLGLYASGTGATANRPAALLSNTASFVNNGAAGFYSAALGANQQLTPGIYWLAVQCNDTTAILLSGANTGTSFEILMGSSTGAGAIGAATAQTNGVTIPSTFGTWATAVGATFTEQTNARDPLVAFKIASIP